MNTQGRKEVGEAVLIAGLTALVTGLVSWGIEKLKQRKKRRR